MSKAAPCPSHLSGQVFIDEPTPDELTQSDEETEEAVHDGVHDGLHVRVLDVCSVDGCTGQTDRH